MEDLIKALQIFLKYSNLEYPTSCDHDAMYIMGIELDEVSSEDVEELEALGFDWSDESGCFMSFKFGSA